jgi:hypothetical protein
VENLQEHLPRHDRRRARARSAGHERSREAEARPARACDLNHITFIAKIKIEPSEDARYGDQNRLDRVVLPGEKEWKLVMDGKDVPASPSRSRGAGSKAAATQPAWTQATGQGGQPAAAQSRSPQTSGAPAWSQPSFGAGAPAAKPPGPAWLNG